MHAGARDDHHRAVRCDARRVDERRGVAGRNADDCALARRNTAIAPDCSGRRTSNRGSARRKRSTKTAWRGSAKPGRTAASNGWNSRITSTCGTRTTTYGSSSNHPEAIAGFYPMITPQGMQNTAGGGATGAIQVWDNPVPREVYHTDWVADRTIAWLDTSAGGRRLVRVAQFSRSAPSVGSAGIGAFARQLARRAVARSLSAAMPRRRRDGSASKPRHWRGYFDGSLWTQPRIAARFSSVRHDGGSGARDQRDEPHRERTDRRRVRPRARVYRTARLGAPTPTCCSPPTTANCRATTGCCSKGRITAMR